MRVILFSIIVCFLMFSTRASGQDITDREELDLEQALTLDVATPHTDWARPYARGKIRVLFFTSCENSNPRECVELMQR